MDFSQIKAITIPEGSVKQITDSHGNILWQKQAPALIYNVIMFTIRCTVSSKAGYFDVNMFNGNQGTLVNNVTGTDQYFCVLTESQFNNFNNRILPSGTTIGNEFTSSLGRIYRLCYIENNTAYLVGGGNTTTNDTPIGYSTSWYSAGGGVFYPSASGTNTATNSRMFKTIYSDSISLRINASKKPVYHTNSDATGFTIENRQSITFIK